MPQNAIEQSKREQDVRPRPGEGVGSSEQPEPPGWEARRDEAKQRGGRRQPRIRPKCPKSGFCGPKARIWTSIRWDVGGFAGLCGSLWAFGGLGGLCGVLRGLPEDWLFAACEAGPAERLENQVFAAQNPEFRLRFGGTSRHFPGLSGTFRHFPGLSGTSTPPVNLSH